MTTTSLSIPHFSRASAGSHVLRKRLELQHDVPALTLGGVLLLDERIEQLGDPCLEIGRFEHVKAFVIQIPGDDELG